MARIVVIIHYALDLLFGFGCRAHGESERDEFAHLFLVQAFGRGCYGEK